MAELGTLGTAVGVASLGIQVLSGLISYYLAYKDQYAIAQKIHQQVTTAYGLLSITREVLLSLSQEHGQVKAQVETLVVQCSSSVVELKAVLEQCNQASNQAGQTSLKDQIQRRTQRATFPFRLESLQSVQKNVGIVQQNLHLAINVLHL